VADERPRRIGGAPGSWDMLGQREMELSYLQMAYHGVLARNIWVTNNGGYSEDRDVNFSTLFDPMFFRPFQIVVRGPNPHE
jgi:hypothetical protein